jgi:AraC-like DNA-binding protein
MLYEPHTESVYKGSLAAITDFQCRKVETNCLLPEEVMPAPVVLFPRRGVFYRHGAGDPVLGDPNHVLFFNRDEPFRISYPKAGGDDSTLFAVSPTLLTEILAVHDPRAAHGEPRFPVSRALSDPDLFLVHEMLLRKAAEGRPADALSIEEGVVRLIGRAIAAAYGRDGNGNGNGNGNDYGRNNRRGNKNGNGHAAVRSRPSTGRAHRDCAEQVKELLAQRYHEHPSLNEIARAVCVSPYHLCRVFSQEVGVPIHRYLNRLRLRTALPHIADRRMNLSELALDLGYSSHSHFSDAFRREFGMTPSGFRHSANSILLLSLTRRMGMRP